MSKSISGTEYPLAQIFSKDFEYHIPSYQRPYSWTKEHAGELFDDLLSFYQTGAEESYFLGSIVLIKAEDAPYAEVIDGQQRLTTLTILLATIGTHLAQERKSELQQYLMEAGKEIEGIKSKPRLTLRGRDAKFFEEHVQNINFEKLLSFDPAQLENDSQRNIQENSKYFLRVLGDSFSPASDELFRFLQFLINRCYLVAVSTPNQTSAFRVFSVMNSRGLDLQATDILKADIIGNISEEKREKYNKLWEDMEVDLGREAFNDLFQHIRMIYMLKKSPRNLCLMSSAQTY